MLPFANIDFYLLFALLVALLVYGLKALLSGRVSLVSVLIGISLFYAVAYFPKPWQILLFTTYQCLFTWLLLFRWKRLHKLLGSLLLALPMVLVKLDWNVDVIGFAGISYITFRCIQVYLDGESVCASKFRFAGTFIAVPAVPSCSLLAGPIDRYERFKGDLDQGWSRLNGERAAGGVGVHGRWACCTSSCWRSWWTVTGSRHATAVRSALAHAEGDVRLHRLPLLRLRGLLACMAIGLGRMHGRWSCRRTSIKPWLTENPPRSSGSVGTSASATGLRDYFFRPIYKSAQRRAGACAPGPC
jgi:hypothetical protein